MSEKNNSKIGLIVNLILVVAVAILFVMHFNQNGARVESNIEVTEDADSTNVDIENAEEVNIPTDFSIAYVNTDSLWDQYKMVKDALAKLERQETNAKLKLENAGKQFQAEYENYIRQGKAGLLTLQQQKDTEAMLARKQEEALGMEQRLSQQLMMEKQSVNNQITDTILSFLNTYRIENNYTLILQYGYSSGLLAATPELDVTKEVISRLNSKYEFDKNH